MTARPATAKKGATTSGLLHDRAAVLSRPEAFRDDTWATRISRAREARSGAQELRRGKPSAAPTHLAQP
jgi:hypothetical protein